MEPFSTGLLICGIIAAMYQMSGTPFVLNITIFFVILSICLYAVFVSRYRLPSDAVYFWIYPKNAVAEKEKEDQVFGNHDDQITKKLRELTGHIVRDFILSWYNTVTDDVAFVQQAFEMFDHIFTCARTRVAQAEKERLLSSILLEFLKHVETYKNASKRAEIKGNDSRYEEERRNQLIAISYYAENNHPALASLPDSEMEYLRGIVALALKGLLPDDYRLNDTPLYLVRELIAQNVLNSVLNLLSDPLWIYNTIADILDEEESADDIQDCAEDISAGTDVAVANRGKCEESSDSVITPIESANVPHLDEETVSFPENIVSVSHSSSIGSRLSDDSQDILDLISLNPEEVPLPLLSSEMHFAMDQNEPNVSTVRKHLLSAAVESTPPDRLFHRVRIAEYTVMKENFDASKKYALYKITFQTKEKGQTQSSSPINIPTAKGSRPESSAEGSAMQEETITRQHQVQRRFREFLVLQERLSQNMVAKNLIGDIKGPSRMFPVPFGNMDKDYIEQRRKFLQAYLRKICSIPFISNTKEVKEFLAYEMDPRIAYVKKPDSMPRFDELFKSAFQDLFGSASMTFSGTVPNKDTDQAFQTEQHDDHRALNEMTNSFPNGEVSNIGAVTKLKNKVLRLSRNHSHEKPSSARSSRQFSNLRGQRPFALQWKGEDEVEIMRTNSSPGCMLRGRARGHGDGCDAVITEVRDTNDESVPSNLILKLVLKVWPVSAGTHGVATVTLTKYIEAYLSNKVAELTTQEAWTKYLDALQNALWPDGEWESSESLRPTWATASEEVRSQAISRAEASLKQALPNALKYIMSEEDYCSGTKLLVDSLQNININRLLIYRLLDLIILELFPDLDRVSQSSHISLSTHSNIS